MTYFRPDTTTVRQNDITDFSIQELMEENNINLEL